MLGRKHSYGRIMKCVTVLYMEENYIFHYNNYDKNQLALQVN